MTTLTTQIQKFPWNEFYANVKRWQTLLDRIEDKKGENYKYYSQILDYLFLLASKEKQIEELKLADSNQRYYLRFLQERNNFLEEAVLRYRTEDQVLNDVVLMDFKKAILNNMDQEVAGG